jgi:hypothetical protein
MPLQDAIKFIHNATQDKELRIKCYEGAEQNKLFQHIKLAGYSFSFFEFEDAMRLQILSCKDEFDANNLKQFELWFKLLLMKS